MILISLTKAHRTCGSRRKGIKFIEAFREALIKSSQKILPRLRTEGSYAEFHGEENQNLINNPALKGGVLNPSARIKTPYYSVVFIFLHLINMIQHFFRLFFKKSTSFFVSPCREPSDLRSAVRCERNSQVLLTGEELYRAAQGMHLQWFAAEDEGRVHDPTEATYRRAREEGRVAKSQELIAALGLLLPALTIIFLAPWMFRTCAEMLRFFFNRINELDPLTDRFTFGIFINYYVRLALPVLVVGIAAGLFSNLVQVGFLFTTKPLEPDFSKILPKFGRYFQRTLFSMEGLFNLAKSIFKMSVIGAVAFFIIRSRFKELANLQTAGLWPGVTLVATLAAQLLVISALLLLFLSIPDIFFQRWQFKESLKMTREAAKEELKQDEGDPEIRRRLRNRYREMLSRNMLNAVPNADVVITNPTHYSVALEFDAGKMEAPTVIAKGEDELALRIREVANANGVPVESHPPLTRALYQETEVGDVIPIKYWNVVIIILAKFYNYDQMQKKARRVAARESGRMGA